MNSTAKTSPPIGMLKIGETYDISWGTPPSARTARDVAIDRYDPMSDTYCLASTMHPPLLASEIRDVNGQPFQSAWTKAFGDMWRDREAIDRDLRAARADRDRFSKEASELRVECEALRTSSASLRELCDKLESEAEEFDSEGDCEKEGERKPLVQVHIDTTTGHIIVNRFKSEDDE